MKIDGFARTPAFMAAVALSAISATPAAAKHAFSHYPVTKALEGAPVHPDYRGAAATYRTKIRQAVQAGPNAAGHYAIIPIGCGGSCTVVQMVDLRDGTLLAFPVGGEDYYGLAIDFDLTSRLIIADWKDTSGGSFNVCVRRYYQIADRAFTLLNETRRTVDEEEGCAG